jgi:hypothetical protein
MLIPIDGCSCCYDTKNDWLVSSLRGTRTLTPRVLKDGSRRWVIEGVTVSDTNVYRRLKLNDNPHDFNDGDKVEVICDVRKIANALNAGQTDTHDWFNDWINDMSYLVGRTGVVFITNFSDRSLEAGVPVRFPDGTLLHFPSAALKKVSMATQPAQSASADTQEEVHPLYQYVIFTTHPSERMFTITSDEPLTPDGVMQRAIDTRIFDANSMAAGRRFIVCEVSSMHHVEVKQAIRFDVHNYTGA